VDDDEPAEPETCKHRVARDRQCEDCEWEAWNTEKK
jgi:hypothetical protein